MTALKMSETMNGMATAPRGAVADGRAQRKKQRMPLNKMNPREKPADQTFD
jgi:hypothetical protein